MEVGRGMLRKRCTVEETELRSSKSKRGSPNFNQLDDDDDSSVVNYVHLPPIISVDACSENNAASSCSSELKHGELRSDEVKVSNPALTEISKSLDENSFSGRSKQQQMEETSSSTVTRKSKPSTSSSSSPRVINSSTAKTPTMEEIESFFSASEKYEQKRFSEKYNFDVVKDVPMEEGRYEWVKIN